jgi:WD40 repeat protein
VKKKNIVKKGYIVWLHGNTMVPRYRYIYVVSRFVEYARDRKVSITIRTKNKIWHGAQINESNTLLSRSDDAHLGGKECTPMICIWQAPCTPWIFFLVNHIFKSDIFSLAIQNKRKHCALHSPHYSIMVTSLPSVSTDHPFHFLLLWELSKYSCKYTLNRHTKPVTCLQVSSDGSLLLSGGE